MVNTLLFPAKKHKQAPAGGLSTPRCGHRNKICPDTSWLAVFCRSYSKRYGPSQANGGRKKAKPPSDILTYPAHSPQAVKSMTQKAGLLTHPAFKAFPSSADDSDVS